MSPEMVTRGKISVRYSHSVAAALVLRCKSFEGWTCCYSCSAFWLLESRRGAKTVGTR
jgi:hypothetical protein